MSSLIKTETGKIKLAPKLTEVHRTIALFHAPEGSPETVAIDFDAGTQGRVGRLNIQGLYVEDIPGGTIDERKKVVRSYLEKHLGVGHSNQVVNSAMGRGSPPTSYKTLNSEGVVQTGNPPVLPLEKVVAYERIEQIRLK